MTYSGIRFPQTPLSVSKTRITTGFVELFIESTNVGTIAALEGRDASKRHSIRVRQAYEDLLVSGPRIPSDLFLNR